MRYKKVKKHYSAEEKKQWAEARQQERENEIIESEKRTIELNLPKLKGTDAQIEYAKKLRIRFIDSLTAFIENKDNCSLVEDILKTKGIVVNEFNISLSEMLNAMLEYMLQEKIESKFWIEEATINFKQLASLSKEYLQKMQYIEPTIEGRVLGKRGLRFTIKWNADDADKETMLEELKLLDAKDDGEITVRHRCAIEIHKFAKKYHFDISEMAMMAIQSFYNN